MRGLLRWAAFVALFYVAALGVWAVVQPAYLSALRGALLALRSASLVPLTLEPVTIPGLGLAVLVSGQQGLAIPQRILGADFALTIALMLGTYWLPWRRRGVWLAIAAACVFGAHLATILSEYWTRHASSTGAQAAWSLWTTLYQGKVVPLTVWALFLACSMRTRDARTADTAST